MKKFLSNIVKQMSPLYIAYFYLGTFLLKGLKLLVKQENNLILFVSFGGKKYDDSPKTIYEQMLKDNRFSNYKFIWALHQPGDFDISGCEKVKTDTLKYYVIALKAKYWITNSRIERGLNFKGKNTFYINTWHGTPIKKMGTDIPEKNKSFVGKLSWDAVDLMLAQGEYDRDVFSRVFNIRIEKFLLTGLPRNDVLVTENTERKKIEKRHKLGIPLGKKVILYAPTFREFEMDKFCNSIIEPQINFDKWKSRIGDEYIILLRAHYETVKVLNVSIDNDFIYDVSNYHSVNDLMLASDVLISDYSSMFFDFSILNRPMFVYAYDYERYNAERGFYFDIREYISGGYLLEDELIELIKTFSTNENLKMVEKFRKKYVQCYGNATGSVLDIVHNNMIKSLGSK